MRYFIVGVDTDESVDAIGEALAAEYVREITNDDTVTSKITYHDAVKHGQEWGSLKAIKKLADLKDDPDSIERMSQRLQVSEAIVDWVVSYFDHYRKCIKENKRPYSLNGHYEWHAREQQKMREVRNG